MNPSAVLVHVPDVAKGDAFVVEFDKEQQIKVA